MERDTLRQIHGGVQLAADAVDAAVGAIADAHQSIARKVYAPFASLGPLAGPARAVEYIQASITGQVYLTIRGVTRRVAGGALSILERQVK